MERIENIVEEKNSGDLHFLLFWQCFNPFPNDKFWNRPNSKKLQTTFDENDRKFSKWVENTVWKGEIACYEQFLLFSQCFQKTCSADTLKTRACLGKG